MSLETIRNYNQRMAEEYCRQHGLDIFNPEMTVESQEVFAHRIHDKETQLYPGVQLRVQNIDLPDGSFTRSYDVLFNPDDNSLDQSIFTANQPFYLRRLLRNNHQLLTAINAGFFFLTDDVTPQPLERGLNLVVRNRLPMSLPVTNRAAVMEYDGRLRVQEIAARGIIQIGNADVKWIGSRVHEMVNRDSVLYSAASSKIQHIRSSTTGSRRVLIQKSAKTPENPEMIDVAISLDIQNTSMIVSKIVDGGGSDFLNSNFTLQIPKSNVRSLLKVGNRVTPLLLDEVDFSHIESAISIGPSIDHFIYNNDHDINHDPSLGSRPPFVDRRMARSVIYKDIEGLIHLRVFDGAPRTKSFQGLAPQEVAKLIPPDSVQWAYHLDPGQSSKLVTKPAEGKVESFGNNHYLRGPKNVNQTFLWNGPNGRPVASAITIGIK